MHQSVPALAKVCYVFFPLSGPAKVIPSSRTSFRGIIIILVSKKGMGIIEVWGKEDETA